MTDTGAQRPPRASSARRVSAMAAVIVVGVVVAIVVPLAIDTGVAQQPAAVSMTLTDQRFTVSGGDDISLSYDIAGTLPAAVLPTTTTTTTTTSSTTTAPPPDPGPGGQLPDVPAGPPPGDTPANATSTTSTSPPPTAPPPPAVDGKVRVLVYPRITEQSQIETALAGDLPEESDDGVELELTDLLTVDRRSEERPARRDMSLDVDVPVADGVSGEHDLDLPRPGLYPVKVQIRLDDDAVAEHVTLVQRVGDEPPQPLRLGVMAGARNADADVMSDLIALGDVDVPLSVAIPPDVLDEARRTDRRRFDQLADALRGDEAVSMPSDGLDASSAANAELDALFSQHLHDGETRTIQLLPETPVRRTVWPLVDNDLSVDGANLVVGLGVRLFVVTPWVTSLDIESPPPTGHQTLVDLPDGDAGALTIDSTIAALLDSPPDGRTALDQALRLLSRLTLDPDTSSSRGVVLATETLSVPDAGVVEAVAQLIDGSDDISFAPVSALPGLATIDSSSTVDLPDDVGVDLRPRVSEVNEIRLALANTSSMLLDNGGRQAEWTDRLDALLTTDIDDERAQAVLDELSAESDAIRNAVEAPASFTFTLTGRSSEILIPITNNSTQPLRVEVVPSSPKLTFPEGAPVITLQPDATTSVPIDVVARSNGRSSVAIRVQTPSHDELVPPVFLTANVTSLTGLSQLVTGGAILVLLTWWVSHFRQRRRERRLAMAQGRHPTTTMPGDVSPDAAEATADDS